MNNDFDMNPESFLSNFRGSHHITRQRIAGMSGVPLSTVARFEQKGLIVFESLIKLAMALGYAGCPQSIRFI